MGIKLLTWNKYHAIAMIIGVCCSVIWARPYIISLVVLGSFLLLGYTQSSYIKTYANLVTVFRFLLIIGVSFLFETIDVEMIFWILVVAIALDGVDGYLARKYNQSSEVGFYFDMEVDAFFVMLMGLYYYHFRDVGIWILIPGLIRYIYSLMLLIFPQKTFVEQKTDYSKYIAGFYFVVLLGELILEKHTGYYALLLGSVLVVFSFLASFYSYFINQELK